MKSLVTSVFLLQNAFGSAIGIGVVRRATDPNMVTFFACLAGVTGLCGIIFFVVFKSLNKQEDEMNKLEDTVADELKVRPLNEVHTAIGSIKEKVSKAV